MACQLFVNPLTAVGLLDSVRRPGAVVQTAAGSAVGRLVIQLAAQRGLTLINLVRGEATARDLRRRGVPNVICTAAPRWAAQARRAAGAEPLVACLDPIAGPAALELLELLSPGGELILYGGLAGAPVPIGAMQTAARDLSVRGFWLSPWLERQSERRRRALQRRTAAMLDSGTLSIPIAGVFPLADFRQAVLAAESAGRVGKILLDLRA
jgi:NADPH:quinone reductase-like Zn-dependent oxidoreductase